MGWRRMLRPIPFFGSKSISRSCARWGSLSFCEISHAEESVREAPKPSICWYLTESSTSMERAGMREGPNCSGGFSRSDSCKSSEDSATAMRRGARDGGAEACVFGVGDCAERENTASKHNSDARHKISLGNSADGYIRVLIYIYRSLRILGIGRWLRRIWILLNLIPFQRLLRALRLFVFELLKGGQSFLRVSHAMEATINDSELIPGLPDHFGVRTGGRGSSLETLSSGGIIAKQHFRAAEIVVHMEQARLLSQCCLDELLALWTIALFDGQHAQLVFRQGVVGIDFQFALECFFGFLRLSEVAILRPQLLVQAGLRGSEFNRDLVFHNGIYMPVGLGVRLGNDLMYSPGM